jgi:hypothetical protein
LTDNLIINSIDRYTSKSAVTSEIDFIAYDMQNFTLTNGEETVYGTGKAGRRISALKRNKTTSISFDNAYVSLGQMAVQLGTTVETASTETLLSPNVEAITVASGGLTAVTSYKAEGSVGSEIKVAYKANADGTPDLSKKFTQGTTATSTVFTYTPATKTITFASGVALVAGDKLVVSYDYLTDGKKIVNNGDNFSKTRMGILDMTLTTACDRETLYHGRMVFPILSSSGQFELALGGDQVIHNFTGDALPDFCSGGNYWYWIIPDLA